MHYSYYFWSLELYRFSLTCSSSKPFHILLLFLFQIEGIVCSLIFVTYIHVTIHIYIYISKYMTTACLVYIILLTSLLPKADYLILDKQLLSSFWKRLLVPLLIFPRCWVLWVRLRPPAIISFNFSMSIVAFLVQHIYRLSH